MVSILCGRTALMALVNPAETCLSALGLPRYTFWRSVARAVAVWVALPLGYHFGGVAGLIWATIASEIPALLVLWPKLRRMGILRFDRELLAVLLFATGLAVGHAVAQVLPAWHLFRHH
jgi:O-antigen/teichoic acid export membrane protein